MNVIGRFFTYTLCASLITPATSWAAPNEYAVIHSTSTTLEPQPVPFNLNASDGLPGVYYTDTFFDPIMDQKIKIEITYTQPKTVPEYHESVDFINQGYVDETAYGGTPQLIFVDSDDKASVRYDLSDFKFPSSQITPYKRSKRSLRTKLTEWNLYFRESFELASRKFLEDSSAPGSNSANQISNFTEKFDSWVNDQADPANAIRVQYPAVVERLGAVAQHDILKLDMTMAKVRFTTVGGVSAISLVANTSLDFGSVSNMAYSVLLAAFISGSSSGMIAQHRKDYLTWYSSINALGKSILWLAQKRFENQGYTGAELEAKMAAFIDPNKGSFSKIHETLKFVGTEIVFLSPLIVIMACFGVDLYPNASKFADFFITPTNSVSSMMGSIMLSEIYVALQLTLTATLAVSQGVWDTTNAFILTMKKKAIEKMLNEGMITPEQAATLINRAEIGSSALMIAISILSNSLVVLSMPDGLLFKAIGIGGIATLFGSGILYRKFNTQPEFAKKIEDIKQKTSERIYNFFRYSDWNNAANYFLRGRLLDPTNKSVEDCVGAIAR